MQDTSVNMSITIEKTFAGEEKQRHLVSDIPFTYRCVKVGVGQTSSMATTFLGGDMTNRASCVVKNRSI